MLWLNDALEKGKALKLFLMINYAMTLTGIGKPTSRDMQTNSPTGCSGTDRRHKTFTWHGRPLPQYGRNHDDAETIHPYILSSKISHTGEIPWHEGRWHGNVEKITRWHGMYQEEVSGENNVDFYASSVVDGGYVDA